MKKFIFTMFLAISCINAFAANDLSLSDDEFNGGLAVPHSQTPISAPTWGIKPTKPKDQFVAVEFGTDFTATSYGLRYGYCKNSLGFYGSIATNFASPKTGDDNDLFDSEVEYNDWDGGTYAFDATAGVMFRVYNGLFALAGVGYTTFAQDVNFHYWNKDKREPIDGTRNFGGSGICIELGLSFQILNTVVMNLAYSIAPSKFGPMEHDASKLKFGMGILF